jgi:hypothetical protein
MGEEQGESSMATNPIAAVTNSISSVFDLDRRTQRAIVAHSNRTQAQAEVARAALQAMSDVYVYSEYQTFMAELATQSIENNLAAAGMTTADYQTYHRMMRHEYLQQMALAMHKAMTAINRLLE